MIYFYSRASVKHLGFITRFEKKKKRTTSWHSVGSTFEVPTKFRAICFTLLIIQWKSTEQFLFPLFIYSFLVLVEFYSTFTPWELPGQVQPNVGHWEARPARLMNLWPQQSTTFGFDCCGLCKLARRTWPFFAHFHSLTCALSPANDWKCQLLEQGSKN